MHAMPSPHAQNGMVLVATLGIILVLTLAGIAALTNSKIERLMASNDTMHKTVFAATEYALVLAESTIERQTRAVDPAANTAPGSWGVDQQPPWELLHWDETDSLDTTPLFHDPAHPQATPLSSLPTHLQRLGALPRYMVEARGFQRDSLTIGIGEPTGVWTFHVSVNGKNAKQTTHVTLQSVYAKRYN